MTSVTDKLKTFSVTSVFSPLSEPSFSDESLILPKIGMDWRFLTKIGNICCTFRTFFDTLVNKGRRYQTAQKSATNTTHRGNYAKFLATITLTMHNLPKVDSCNQNNSNLPPNLMSGRFSRQITHSTMSTRRYRAVLRNSESDMEVEHELHAGGNETNPAPPQDATDAGPNLNNPGDSSMLMGYSTMEESTPKEEDLDKNANKTDNVSEPLSLYSESASDESITCVKHIVYRGKPTMTGTGSYDQLIKRTKANAVANAFKRSRMARASNSI
jgi:hypothetical protein